MSINANDLLKPRYKVINDWPGRRDFVVGEIVTLDKDFSPQYKKYEVEDCSGVRTYITPFFEMFPLHFKRLKWFEEIKYTELPEYIKWTDPSNKTDVVYFKAEGWSSSPNMGTFCKCHTTDALLFIDDCEPATKEEYESYLNIKL